MIVSDTQSSAKRFIMPFVVMFVYLVLDQYDAPVPQDVGILDEAETPRIFLLCFCPVTDTEAFLRVKLDRLGVVFGNAGLRVYRNGGRVRHECEHPNRSETATTRAIEVELRCWQAELPAYHFQLSGHNLKRVEILRPAIPSEPHVGIQIEGRVGNEQAMTRKEGSPAPALKDRWVILCPHRIAGKQNEYPLCGGVPRRAVARHRRWDRATSQVGDDDVSGACRVAAA